MESKILAILDEQVAVGFTGKVNVLQRTNRQFLGHIIFKEGDIIQSKFRQSQGLKGLYLILTCEIALEAFDYVVEPEVVEDIPRQINLTYSSLKQKLSEMLKEYRESLKLRPPGHVRIILDAEFLDDSLPVSSSEFEVINTLVEWSKVDDVYQRCPLLDHEITRALVELRKKGALKIMAAKDA
jgi:uncharacterized small protein (DUF1192 family)